jgi:hypothetical protein
VEANRKLCNVNGGISLAGGSQAQKCIQLYELRFPNTRKEREKILARKIRQGWYRTGINMGGEDEKDNMITNISFSTADTLPDFTTVSIRVHTRHLVTK